MSPPQHLEVADLGMIAGLSAFVVGHAAIGQGLKVKMTPSLSLDRYSLHPRRQNASLGMGR